MKSILALAVLASTALAALPATAQTGTAPPSLPWVRSADKQISVRTNPVQCVNNAGNEVLCGGPVQEVRSLASANTAAAAVSVIGGQYLLNQACTAYGSVVLRYRSADGTTMIPMVTRTAADNSGGTLVALGSNQVVDAVLTGTTGCNVNLVRIP